jgi:hypothetical protein
MGTPETAADLFEAELNRRGIPFRREATTGRYEVESHGRILKLSLDNLERGYQRDADSLRISTFLDAALGDPGQQNSWPDCREGLFLCLEAKLVEAGPYRDSLTDRIDQVLVYFDSNRNLLSHVFPSSLATWNLSLSDAKAVALENLAQTLLASKVEFHDTHGVRLGFIGTRIPFKSALILAPNVKQVLSPILGWPLLAVVPDRDFLFLWDAAHPDFANYVGRTVLKEFASAPYPLTTEVLRIDDDGIAPIGAF